MNTQLLPCLLAVLLPLAAWPADSAKPLSLVPITTPKPDIPDAACQQRLSGWVEMDFAVMPDGRVAEVRVIASQPAGAFDAAAVAAVSGRLYAPQGAPVKLHERMLMTFADCRAEQLRAGPATESATGSAEDCAVLAAAARQAGERFDAAESGRAVLAGETAPVFSAPAARCASAGRTLRAGGKWTAHLEYQGYSFISGPRPNEAAGIWVLSKQLKDTDPVARPPVPALAPTPPTTAATPTAPVPRAPASGSGERLAYLVGCVNCHHQTPKEIVNAPPLAVVQAYSPTEFRRLMRTGVTRAGRDLLAESSLMGIVAVEQFSQFTDDEVTAVYDFLRTGWSAERAAQEEARIPLLYKKPRKP